MKTGYAGLSTISLLSIAQLKTYIPHLLSYIPLYITKSNHNSTFSKQYNYSYTRIYIPVKGGLPSLCSGFPEKSMKTDFPRLLVLVFQCFLGMSSCMKRFKNGIWMLRNGFCLICLLPNVQVWVDCPKNRQTQIKQISKK